MNDSINKVEGTGRTQESLNSCSPQKRMGPTSKVFFKVPQIGGQAEDQVSDMQEEEDYLRQEAKKREQRKRDAAGLLKRDKESEKVRSVSKSLKRIEMAAKASKDKT